MLHLLLPIVDSLKTAFFMFWETLWALVLGFGLSGVVQAFVSRGQMERTMGSHGLPSIGRATFFGMVSSSCSYAASAMAKSLFQKGADFIAALVFMFASTSLVFELGIVLLILMGWQFTASEFVGGLIMIALFSLVAPLVLHHSLIDAARRRVQTDVMPDHAGHTAAEEGTDPIEEEPWRQKLRSPAGWADAASYAMADVTMPRNEMLIGYLVAGSLAVLVPTSTWNDIFLQGHSFWTSLENVLVGPFELYRRPQRALPPRRLWPALT